MGQLSKNENYRTKGYYVTETNDSKGFVSQRNYYKSYDEGTDTYSNLKVREDITNTYDPVTGLITKENKISRWYKNGQEMTSKVKVSNLDSIQGYQRAQKGRAKLAAVAGMQLMGAVGQPDAQAFLSTVIQEREEYIAGNRAPLVAAINASTESYMTQTVKDTLVATLDIDYGI
jgi:hypothetical protein